MTTEQINELKQALNNGVVSFIYTKKDGTERNATGTLCESIILEKGGEMPKGTGETPNQTIPYWDVEKCAWRSCLKDNLVSWVK
jgi:hypothetical protein